MTFVPGGCTSLIQPVDVVVNKPFKEVVDRLATTHMQENLDDYVRGKITASERRALFTKWVGQAWEEVSAKKDMVQQSFMKTGIAVAIDGSQDEEINIGGLENYRVDSDEDEGDPFAENDDHTEDEDNQVAMDEDSIACS